MRSVISSRAWIVVVVVLIMFIATIAVTAFAVQRIVLLHLVGDPHLGVRALVIIAGSGLALATLAVLVGVLMGRQRMRPVASLVAACRQGDGPAPSSPIASGEPELDRLAVEIHRLAVEVRTLRAQLAEVQEREVGAQAVRQRFLVRLGHELVEPLRRLIVLLDGAITHPGGGAPERLMEMRQCASVLEERFQEVIGLSAGAAVDAADRNEPMSLRGFAEGVADQLRPQAQARGLSLTVAASDEVLPIPVRLFTPVLVNLVANAVRATVSGGVAIAVVRRDAGTEWIIADTGPGMAVDLAERIADCCRRGEVIPGTTGVGFGLTLALANVRGLDGRIELVRNTPQGASFRVILPGTG